MLIKQSAPSPGEKPEAFSTSTPLSLCGFIPVQLFSDRGWAKLGDLGKPSIPETKKLASVKKQCERQQRLAGKLGSRRRYSPQLWELYLWSLGRRNGNLIWCSFSILSRIKDGSGDGAVVCAFERETETEREGGKKGTRGGGWVWQLSNETQMVFSNPPPIPASLPPPSPAPSLPFFPPGLSYLKTEDFSAAWAC